jgi:tRNA(Ile)-lysidine synthase
VPVAPVLERFLTGLGDAVNAPLGLAVSGGGDSMAMLYLAVDAGLQVQAVTVDHGLRAESADEAAMVARACAGLGVAHATLRWQGWDRKGNLQDHARRARRRLIAAWAEQAGCAAVALAHSQDDLAETFLMRLARGAGLDGLSAMSAHWTEGGIAWHRPLLTVSRAELRAVLTAKGVAWVDDPSNALDRFDRVKARKALQVLAPLGLSSPRLADVARHLGDARAALDSVTDTAAQALLQIDGGAVLIRSGFAGLADEVQRRLLLRVLLWVAPTDYGPRGPALLRLRQALLAGKASTLAGCRFVPTPDGIRICREAKAVAGLVAPVGQAWDGWQLTGPAAPGQTIRALGVEGLAQCPDWRATGRPRAALLASPAVWQQARLIAAPLAQFGPEWQASRILPPDALIHCALSH